jgi:hypothetical protein
VGGRRERRAGGVGRREWEGRGRSMGGGKGRRRREGVVHSVIRMATII